ncbi:MAG: YaaA family protein [Phocaeicola sp.]
MLIFISCAKTMGQSREIELPLQTTPLFQREANENALEIVQYNVEELGQMLKVNREIALENFQRYQTFHSPDNAATAAICSYTGAVFKQLNPSDFTTEELLYAQNHLRISSFLYGILRPLDLIKLYRLEGNVTLPNRKGETMFHYWRPLLTDLFISEIKSQGGILLNLASNEMKSLFEWKRVEAAVRIITPEFQVWKNGKLKTIVIYTKKCRGEMARFILKNQLTTPDALAHFEWEGFKLDESRSSENQLLFTME